MKPIDSRSADRALLTFALALSAMASAGACYDIVGGDVNRQPELLIHLVVTHDSASRLQLTATFRTGVDASGRFRALTGDLIANGQAVTGIEQAAGEWTFALLESLPTQLRAGGTLQLTLPTFEGQSEPAARITLPVIAATDSLVLDHPRGTVLVLRLSGNPSDFALDPIVSTFWDLVIDRSCPGSHLFRMGGGVAHPDELTVQWPLLDPVADDDVQACFQSFTAGRLPPMPYVVTVVYLMDVRWRVRFF
jgi:hypothetical protein